MTIPWDSDSHTVNDRSEDTQQDPCLTRGFDVYDARITINHWQLRDCVKPVSSSSSSSSNSEKVCYIFDHSIRSLEMKNGNFDESNNNNNDNDEDDNSDLFSLSKHVVQFNFKPRCFTERKGLIACGGLIGSDDIGFPGNWNRLVATHEESSDASSPSASPSPPAEPIKLRNRDMLLNDKSHYSNPQIWKGILSLYNKNTGYKTSVILGQFINNCVTLYDRSNAEFDLYSCNNDSHLYQCNVSNRAIELVRRHADLKFSLNNSAISSDGKTLLVSGDSNKFAIYHRDVLAAQFSLRRCNNSTGSKYTSTVYSQPIPRYALGDTTCLVDNGIVESKNGDHGFYNAFSDNDLQFATLFQNGCCLVYDIRNLSNPLAEISSTRAYSHNGAFRVCKFSSGMDDLLFISEHQGRVHVVDTRDFNNHHVICFPNKPTINHHTSLPHTTFSTTPSSSSSSSSPSGNALPYMSLHSGTSAISGRHLTKDMLLKTETDYGSLTTSALCMSSEYLEPIVVPYSKISNDFTEGESNLNAYRSYSSSTVSLSSSSNMSSTLSLPSLQSMLYPQQHIVQASGRGTPDVNTTSIQKLENRTYNSSCNTQRQRFDIRRISTAYPLGWKKKGLNTDKMVRSASPSPITTDPDSVSPPNRILSSGLLHHHHQQTNNTAQRYQQGQHLPFFTREFLFSGIQGYENRVDRSINHYNYTGHTNNNGSSSTYNNHNDDILDASAQLSDENNISGIDWIGDDTGGGSLLIGTDFGVVSWKVDSRARRSFASYDLC